MKKSKKRKSKSLAKPANCESGQGTAKRQCREPLVDVKNISGQDPASPARNKTAPNDNQSSSKEPIATVDKMRESQFVYLSETIDTLWNEALFGSNHTPHLHVDWDWWKECQVEKPDCICARKWMSDVWPLYGPTNVKKFKDYNDIIKKPMDFGTIRGNLLGERYINPSECLADINQVFTNCYIYNHKETVLKARQLEKKFLQLKADMPYGSIELEQLSSDPSEKTKPSCSHDGGNKTPNSKLSSSSGKPTGNNGDSTLPQSNRTPASGNNKFQNSKAAIPATANITPTPRGPSGTTVSNVSAATNSCPPSGSKIPNLESSSSNSSSEESLAPANSTNLDQTSGTVSPAAATPCSGTSSPNSSGEDQTGILPTQPNPPTPKRPYRPRSPFTTFHYKQVRKARSQDPKYDERWKGRRWDKLEPSYQKWQAEIPQEIKEMRQHQYEAKLAKFEDAMKIYHEEMKTYQKSLQKVKDAEQTDDQPAQVLQDDGPVQSTPDNPPVIANPPEQSTSGYSPYIADLLEHGHSTKGYSPCIANLLEQSTPDSPPVIDNPPEHSTSGYSPYIADLLEHGHSTTGYSPYIANLLEQSTPDSPPEIANPPDHSTTGYSPYIANLLEQSTPDNPPVIANPPVHSTPDNPPMPSRKKKKTQDDTVSESTATPGDIRNVTPPELVIRTDRQGNEERPDSPLPEVDFGQNDHNSKDRVAIDISSKWCPGVNRDGETSLELLIDARAVKVSLLTERKLYNGNGIFPQLFKKVLIDYRDSYAELHKFKWTSSRRGHDDTTGVYVKHPVIDGQTDISYRIVIFPDYQKSIREVKSQLRNITGDKDDLEARINELRNSAQQDFEKENRIRDEKLQGFNGRKKELLAKKKTASQEVDQMDAHVLQAKSDLYTLRQQNSDIDRNIAYKRRLMADLRASRQDGLKRYGKQMPTLLEEIEKAASQGRFHRKPKGPLGRYLNLKDPAWALCIEIVLKSLVFCFCCHDFHDERVLKDIMQRVIRDGRRPTIITSQFEDEKYDLSHRAVQCDIYPTVLHPTILEVDDPVIYNCLCDQRSVEMVLLIKDKNEARDFLKNRPPRNCREGFTIEGDQIYAGSDQRFYSAFQRNAKVLRGDVEAELRHIEEDIRSHEQEKQAGQQRLQQLQNTIRETDRHCKKMKQQLIKIQNEINQIDFEIQQLTAVEETAPVDVFTLEEEVTALRGQMEQHEQQLEQLGFAYKEKNREHETAKKEINELNEECGLLADKVDPLKPPYFRLPLELYQALGLTHIESEPVILNAVRDYINRHDLLDAYESQFINNDKVFRKVFGLRRMRVSHLPQLVESVLFQPIPIILHHTVTMDTNEKTCSYPIDIEMINGKVTVCKEQSTDFRQGAMDSRKSFTATKLNPSSPTTNRALPSQLSTTKAVSASKSNSQRVNSVSNLLSKKASPSHYNHSAILSSSSGDQISSSNLGPNQRRSSAPSTISSPISMTTSEYQTSDSDSYIDDIQAQSSGYHRGNSTADRQPNIPRSFADCAGSSTSVASPPSSGSFVEERHELGVPQVQTVGHISNGAATNSSKPKSPDPLLEAFKEELSCAICTQELQDPKDLDCCHTFCKGCLQEWLDSKSKKTSIPCPVCLKDTDLKDSGVKGLKTSHVIKNLVDQVRSAMVGSTINSPCKIHGFEGMIVKINCQTCEQFVCEKCVDVCKRLNHVIEDQPRHITGGPPGRMLHPLSDKRQKYLTRIRENDQGYIAFGSQMDHIRQKIRTYADKLTENIYKDLDTKMAEIDQVEKDTDEAYFSYADEMKQSLKEVDEAIDKQVTVKAATMKASACRESSRAFGSSSTHPTINEPTDTQQQTVARQHSQEVTNEQREADYESDIVLRKPIPGMPLQTVLTFVASGHDLKDCPVGQVVCDSW